MRTQLALMFALGAAALASAQTIQTQDLFVVKNAADGILVEVAGAVLTSTSVSKAARSSPFDLTEVR